MAILNENVHVSQTLTWNSAPQVDALEARIEDVEAVTVSVMDYNAVGDGVTDDATYFQAAIDALIPTGGVLWLPPDKIFKIGTTIDIRSFFPIFIESRMSQGRGGSGVMPTNGFIKPGGALTNGIFRWRAPATSTTYAENGAGGIRGLTFCDPADRSVTIDSCVYLEDANIFTVDDCYAFNIKGSFLRLGNVVACVHRGGNTHSVGDTSRPVIDVAGGPVDVMHNQGFAGYYGSNNFFHSTYLANVIKVAAACGANLRVVYFENDTTTGDLQNSFVSAIGRLIMTDCTCAALGAATVQVELAPTSVQAYYRITGCGFEGQGKAISANADAQYLTIHNNTFRDAGSDSVDAITAAGANTSVQGNTFVACGLINVSGAGSIIANNIIYASVESTAASIVAAWAGTTVHDNFSSDGYGTGSATWNPGSLVDGAGETSAGITVPGAQLGYDSVVVVAPYDLQGITCTGYVSANNEVKIRLQNETTGTIDLASGTWKVRVARLGL